jgi:esterase/lipase superfamily enzyme
MNLFLKRPDLLNGVLAMSGVYDLTEYTKGYFDDDVYLTVRSITCQHDGP